MSTKLTKLELDNVGGFKDFELNFPENLTVLIGKNGTGKTTILRSIASVFETTCNYLDDEQYRNSHSISVSLDSNGQTVKLKNSRASLPLFVRYPASNVPVGQECIERQFGANKQYEIVRQAIYQMISDEQNTFNNLHITWQQNPNGGLCIEKNGTLLNINQLSAGEKRPMLLVADLAHRLIDANPNSNNPLLQGEGVILIDDIDLHLYPSWQRAIVPNLRNIFPNCQFIIATHSPLVLANVEPKYIVILKDFKALPNTQHTKGRDANSILSDIMGVPSRPEEMQKQLKKCFDLIDDNKLHEAKQKIEDLMRLLGPNDPDVVYIHSLIDFKICDKDLASNAG